MAMYRKKSRGARVNRFGNAEKVIGIKPNRNGYPTGYVEIGNKLYQIGVSHANKDGYDYWVRLTHLNNRPTNF